MKKKYISIKNRVGLLVGLGILVVVMTLAAFSTIRLRKIAINDAKKIVLLEAKNYGSNIKEIFDEAFSGARNTAEMLSAVVDTNMQIDLSRDDAEYMAQHILLRYDYFLGMTLAWESNAFDNNDEEYINTKKSDQTGRFISYLTKDGSGGVVIEPLLDYESEIDAPWYWDPKKQMKEVVTEPVMYPIQGRDVFMISFMSPIIQQGKFLGVTGIDIEVNFLQNLVEEANVFDGFADISVLSNEGMYAANSKNSELVGKNISGVYDINIKDEKLIVTDESIEVIVPIQLGYSDTPWQVHISLPLEVITREANRTMHAMMGIGLLLTIIGFVSIYFIINTILKLLGRLVQIVKKVSEGDLRKMPNLSERNDEVFLLGNTIKEMVEDLKKSENALKENEYFLKEAQKIAKLGHWRLDNVNNKLSWSEEVYRIFEQSQQEFVVTPEAFLNLVHPDDRDNLEEASKKALKNKTPHEFEHRVLLKNGEIKYVIEKSITEYDLNGKPLHSIGTVQDITKLKLAQQQLKESEERYKLLSDLSNEGLIIHKEGTVIDVNNTFCNMFKYSREELIGSNPMGKIFTPESMEILKQKISNEITSTYEVIGVSKNGRIMQIEIEARNFIYQNEKVRVALLRDITDKIKKDKELKESAERFRTHYNNMPIATYTWQQKDDDFVLIEYNAAAEEATKGSMKNLTGEKLSFIYEDKKNIIADINICYNTKRPIQKEMLYKSYTGDQKILDVTYVFVPPNNVIVHTNDITERIKAQNFLKESEAKYRLLVENGPSVFWIIDKNGNTKYISDNVKKVCGFSTDEIRSKGSIMGIDRIHKQDIKNVLNNFNAIFTENKRFDISYRIKNKNDKWIWLQVIGEKYILNSGEEVAYGVFRDITAKKNAQQKVYKAMINAEERERSRIANDLHDGVSPILSAIKLYIKSLLNAKDEKIKDEISNKINLTINEAIQSLSDISNKLSPHILQNFGLSTAIQSFIEKVSETTNLHFSFLSDIDKKMDENIETNLYRIIVELINNTIKYANARNAIIKISEKENEIKMHFEHNGKGFNLKEVLKKSKGMGLRNLYNRINSLNGKMDIKTNIDSGLKVDVVIPLNI